MARPRKNESKIYPFKDCESCRKRFKSRLTTDYLAKHPNFGRFCSSRCVQDWRSVPKIERICEVCGKSRLIHRSDLTYGRGRFCSKRCKGRYFSGENSPLYKNGNQSLMDKIRHSPEYRDWRTSVFIRDSRTCTWCGSKEQIEADHIKPQAFYPELRFDINNGRTLCHNCHTLTPNYMNSRMTKEEFELL